MTAITACLLGSILWGGALATSAYVFTIGMNPMFSSFSYRVATKLTLWGGVVIFSVAMARGWTTP